MRDETRYDPQSSEPRTQVMGTRAPPARGHDMYTHSISDDGFINALRVINSAAVVEDLDSRLIQAVSAIFDHGGKAEITLKLKLARIPNMDTAVNITAEVFTKLPKEKPASKALFVTRNFGLSDQPQEQRALPLGPETERPGAKLATIDTATGEIKA